MNSFDRSRPLGRWIQGGLRLMSVLGLTLTVAACETGPFAQKPTIAGNAPIAGTTVPSISTPSTYRVQPGDQLSVFVFDNPDLTSTVIVSPDGKIRYPLAGTVQAAGRTLGSLDSAITSRLQQSILQPDVTVSLAGLGTGRVYVSGEVVQPGMFSVPGQVTVVQAITLAGGFTAFADRKQVLIYNPGRRSNARQIFDYESFLASPGTYDIRLRPGDIVIVP